MPRSTRLRTYVTWARKKLCRWKKARKAAISAIRDGWTIPDLARHTGVDRQWLHKWWGRFLEGGKTWQAIDDRPSRPHSTPTKKRHLHTREILEAKKKWPQLGVVKLAIVADLQLGKSAIHQVLRENNAIKIRKKVWRKYKRFCRPFPNYLWQIDITQVPTKNDGWAFIASILDDHSRFLLASKLYEKELNSGDILGLVMAAIKQWGRPRQILTDRGTQFTSQQNDDPSLFTLTLDSLGIRHIMARPRHPRTIGKIERWHRSVKHEWFAYREELETHEQVRVLLSQWLQHYNFERPHWSVGLRKPGEVFLGGFILDEELARAVNEVSG